MDFLNNFSAGLITLQQLEDLLAMLFWIKILAVIVSLVLLWMLIHFLRSSNYLNDKFFNDWSDYMRPGAVSIEGKTLKKWEKILQDIESSEESDWKLAVVEADKILNNLLKRMGYQGKSLDERLEQIESIHLENIDEIWQAHEIRDLIVRDPTYKLTHEKAKEAIEIYQKTFENLELL